jgi:hypothetical protein
MVAARYPNSWSTSSSTFWALVTYEIPPIIIEWSNFSLEIYSRLTWDNVMVAQALIPVEISTHSRAEEETRPLPRSVLENSLSVHVGPSSLKPQNASS